MRSLTVTRYVFFEGLRGISTRSIIMSDDFGTVEGIVSVRLISTELSPCCGHEAQIVQSRDGGFISRGCLKCGQSHYVNESQLPKLACESCRSAMQIKKLDGTNYFYACPTCERYHKIAGIVPMWSEVFTYSGLAAHGDAGLAY